MTADDVDLVGGELELVGRITVASNATFLARVGAVQVVYKPVAGERPLWDFPDGTLANRESEGIWGGATEKERRRILRHRRKTAAA